MWPYYAGGIEDLPGTAGLGQETGWEECTLRVGGRAYHGDSITQTDAHSQHRAKRSDEKKKMRSRHSYIAEKREK